MIRRSRIVLGLLVPLLALPAGAEADLTACPKKETGDQIYADAVRARNPQEAAGLANVLQSVAFKVVENLDALSMRQPAVHILECTPRFPAGSAEFTPTMCENLVSEDVLLEVWSEVRSARDEKGKGIVVVDLLVAVMPMLAKPDASAPPGVTRLERRFKAKATQPDVFGKVDAFDELLGLSRMAAGLRDADLGYDGTALAALCEAARVLRGIKDPGRRGACAALAGYAERLAEEARTRLQAGGDVLDSVAEAARCGVTP